MALPYYLIDRIDEKGTYLRKGEAYFGSKILLFIRKKGDSVDPNFHNNGGAGAVMFEMRP
jgi:hypothetical protein